VILFNPGEGAVLGTNGDYTAYLGDVTLIGQYAEAVGGAAIIIEHRYWGESSPYTNLTVKNLQYLNVHQSIQDMNAFAEGVVLPFDTTGASNSKNAPWIFVGASYSASLAAWMAVTEPGTFWAYHASSAPVQSISDYVCAFCLSKAPTDNISGNTSIPYCKEWHQTVAQMLRPLYHMLIQS
jgi:hypothetical protein